MGAPEEAHRLDLGLEKVSYGSASYYNGGYQAFGAFKNFRKISPSMQSHLKRVYLTLTWALAAAAVGLYLHLLWNIDILLTGLGCIDSILWLISNPSNPYNEGKRVNLLMATAACKVTTLGSILEQKRSLISISSDAVASQSPNSKNRASKLTIDNVFAARTTLTIIVSAMNY